MSDKIGTPCCMAEKNVFLLPFLPFPIFNAAVVLSKTLTLPDLGGGGGDRTDFPRVFS